MTDAAAGAMPTVKIDVKMVASRYSLVAQFLCSSAQFARRCVDIERIITPDELLQTEHLGLVTAAIMQCVAAVEANSAEVITHGPGSHLGSLADTEETRAFLAPLDEFIDNRREPLKRYKLILHLLRKPPLIEGEQPWQVMQTLVRLRNGLTHHKSKWREEVEENSPFQLLQDLSLPKRPFVFSTSNFLPEQCLNAACAAWSVRTAVASVNKFYDQLGIDSPLTPHMAQFKDL